MQFPLDSESCHNCKQFYSGYGFDFSYRLAKYAWVDTLVNLFPGSGSIGEHGAAQEGLAGFKLGRSIGDWGIYPIFVQASFTMTRLLFLAAPPTTSRDGVTLST